MAQSAAPPVVVVGQVLPNAVVVQPMQVAGMRQPRVPAPANSQQWTHGLFDAACADVCICAYVACCGCCAVGSIGHQLGGSCCSDCCVASLPGLCGCPVVSHRATLRRRYGLVSDCDCVAAWLCPWFATCQHFAELKARGDLAPRGTVPEVW